MFKDINLFLMTFVVLNGDWKNIAKICFLAFLI